MSTKTDNLQTFKHPELRIGEVFLINADRNRFEKLPWKTKRAGCSTFDGNGTPINHEDWFPVFVASEEIFNEGLRSARHEGQPQG
jgi:hypothetical protein